MTVDYEPRLIDLVRELHEAVHGLSWTCTESPALVWNQLLAEVRELRARAVLSEVKIGQLRANLNAVESHLKDAEAATEGTD